MFFGKNPSKNNRERCGYTLRNPGSTHPGHGYTVISAPPFTSKARAAEA